MKLLRAKPYGQNKSAGETYKVHAAKSPKYMPVPFYADDLLALCNVRPYFKEVWDGERSEVTCQRCLARLKLEEQSL